MKKYIFIVLTTLISNMTSAAAANNVTLEDVLNGTFRAERFQAGTPLPDGESYACIKEGKVISYSFRTGKENGILFDVNNTTGEHINDISGFELSPDGNRMLVYTNVKRIYRRSFTADYYTYNIQSHKLSKLSEGGAQQSPVWSPDGNEVAFVRNNNIFLVKLLYDNSESQVTKDGKYNHIINGIPDWVNEEEFALSSSMCFTADGSQICWIKYNEEHVPTYSLQMFKGLNPSNDEYTDYPGSYSYKYPKAGQQNAIVSAWSYDIQSHRTQQIQLPIKDDDYICRIFPTENPQSVLFVTLNRHQDDMKVYSANPRSTLCQVIINEKSNKYVNNEAYSDLSQTKDGLLMLSDRDGYKHIYQYSNNGSLIRSVCPSGIDITTVYGYDQKTGDIFYQAAPTPLTRKVYVSHKNGAIECLTKQEGTNDALFSKDMRYFVNMWSDRNTPYIYTSCQNNGKVISTLINNSGLTTKLKNYAIPTRELFSFTTSEGITLNGWMLRPVNFDSSKKYPVIMHQYSGPGSQQVLDSWRMGSMGEGCAFDAYLCSLGFIVVNVDGRGTGGRGAEFEKVTYLNLGLLESRDQVETALWLQKQSYVDSQRIGIWGWSYGGFNTLMSMSEGREVFACGVAIAPPTNWKYYDSVYTERYMRTPKENPVGYERNPIAQADKLHGSLLICHGLADDNVHPQNTFEYSEALVQNDKDFRELIYTNRNHSIYGANTRRHLLRQVTNHFVENLLKK